MSETKKEAALLPVRSNGGLENATHNLHCTHCLGKSVSYYIMKCILLGITKSGKAKVLVFGERNWSGREHIKRVRYVDTYRITAISPNVQIEALPASGYSLSNAGLGSAELKG